MDIRDPIIENIASILVILALIAAVIFAILPEFRKGLIRRIRRLLGREAQPAADTPTWDVNSPQNDQVRADIIYNVRHNWVDPILNHALHDTVRIRLNLAYDTAVHSRQSIR